MKTAKTIVSVLSAMLMAASIANAGPSLDTPKSDTSKLISLSGKARVSAAKPEAKPQETLLSVAVIDGNGQRMEGLSVEVTAAHGLNAYQEHATDIKGRAYFAGLLADDYLIVVHAEGGFVWTMATVKGEKMEITIKVPVEPDSK